MANLGGQPSDYWWLKPSQPDNPLPAMALGQRMKQNAIDNALNVQRLKLAEQAQGNAALAAFERNTILQEQSNIRNREALAKTKIQADLMEGSANLAALGAEIKDWSDPSVRTQLMEFATRYPMIANTSIFKEFSGAHRFAVGAKRQLVLDRQKQESIDLRAMELQQREDKLQSDLSPIDKMKLTDELSSLKARVKAGDFIDPDMEDDPAGQKRAAASAEKIERARIFNRYRKSEASPQTESAPSVPTAPSSALPMPSVKTELKTGQTYQTPRGVATWDGEKFVQ